MIDKVSRILTMLILIKRWRKKIRKKIKDYLNFKKLAIVVKNLKNHHLLVIKKLRLRITNGQKIRIGFFVASANFQGKELYEQMINDALFDPFFVVIPNLYSDNNYLFSEMNETFNLLSEEFTNVYQSYNDKTNSFIDFSNRCDMICFSRPYDELTVDFYKSSYVKSKEILPFFINYAYSVTNYSIEKVLALPALAYMWKIYVESPERIKAIGGGLLVKNDLLKAVGYTKMDRLNKIESHSYERKKIIIAPHHTVAEFNNGLNISNFLEYSEFFLTLSKLYPDIDFIFRPHPLLFIRLKKEKIWTKNQLESYLNAIEKMPNMIHDKSSDYFDLFINSNGLIHDCGSFLAEYTYTSHPQCYLLRSKESIADQFYSVGKSILHHCYQAFNKEDIIKFIDNVIINEKDTMKEERIKFAKEKIMYNHPNATKSIIENIKNHLT